MGQYREILFASDSADELKRRMDLVQALVWDYRTMEVFGQDLRSLLNKSGRTLILGYANQLLCRTQPEAGQLTPEEAACSYEICFSARLRPLISMLTPDLVLVMGWRKDGKGWSQSLFSPRFRRAKDGGLIPEMTMFLGIHQTSRPNNRERALAIVREFLEEGSERKVHIEDHSPRGSGESVESIFAKARVPGTPAGSRHALTLNEAVRVGENLVVRLRSGGHPAKLRVASTRVSIKLEAPKKQVLGIVPGKKTEISCPWFSPKMAPSGAAFREWRSYRIISLEGTAAEVEALCFEGLLAGGLVS